MTIPSTAVPMKSGPSGRALFWTGIAVCLLGVALFVVHYGLKQLTVPWYSPVIATLGLVLIFGAVVRRFSFLRVLALGLLTALTALQWYFMVSFSRLPTYEGATRPGQKVPAFRTTLADGRPFTDKDLQDGTPSVLVFFRGRW